MCPEFQDFSKIDVSYFTVYDLHVENMTPKYKKLLQ